MHGAVGLIKKYFDTFYNIPLWCKTRSHRNHLWYCSI